jgi:hypothetical protein
MSLGLRSFHDFLKLGNLILTLRIPVDYTTDNDLLPQFSVAQTSLSFP